MKVRRTRKLLAYIDILDQPIRFDHFVFSRVFFIWALTGIAGGCLAGLYWIVLGFITQFLSAFEGLWVIPVMSGCGLLAGLIIYKLGDPGEIHLIVDNIRFNRGKLDPRQNPSMILSSLLCVGGGGSLGPEAPLVQVTGSTGSWLGKIFRLKGEQLRSLTIAGMASGFTALFGAPLGGSLFALEILHHKYVAIYYEAVIPALVASSFSYMVFALLTHAGIGPAWHMPAYDYSGNFDFLLAVLFGVLATATGWVFIYVTKFFKGVFSRFRLPVYVRTTLGGLLLGVLAFYLPLTRYFGHEQLAELLKGQFSIQLLLLLLVGKIIATSITVTSGWRGGFIIPLFFCGAVAGMIIHYFLPGTSLALAMVTCMAAINACVTRTPMSTTILLASLTGFSYFIPILFASLTGYFLAPRIPFITSQMHAQKQHEAAA